MIQFISRNFGLTIVVALVVGIGALGYRLGVVTTKYSYEQKLLTFQIEQDRLVSEIAQVRADIESNKGKRIRTVYVQSDPTGCADTAVPDGVLAAIRKTDDQPNADR